ncbi:MAG: hypothetical protein KAG72_01620 [Abyssibacter sp.]|nr:hypothetical protein [Abyssibacter sp.]MCK5858019.1 hypothetical protein [Abyssibacter sp.]
MLADEGSSKKKPFIWLAAYTLPSGRVISADAIKAIIVETEMATKKTRVDKLIMVIKRKLSVSWNIISK